DKPDLGAGVALKATAAKFCSALEDFYQITFRRPPQKLNSLPSRHPHRIQGELPKDRCADNGAYTALSPCSLVRMRQASSIVDTKTLPSPILPVLAALRMASTADSTNDSGRTVSILILGRKSTVYSLPR